LILVTHDFGVIAEATRRVVVMYAGSVVEERSTAELLAGPRHPYTQALLDALPERAAARRRLRAVPGSVPHLGDRPAGCPFHPQCANATELCRVQPPALARDGDGRLRCHHPLGGKKSR
jgi:dipeptide transport system ATP-binding protein